MAKSQNVSLTPSEITGICGRLRCCLSYEHEVYEEARKLLPKVKKTIQTPLGEGKVTQVLPMTDSVMVYIPEVGLREIKRSELESGTMEEKKPVVQPVEHEESTSSDYVEMVRFDNVGRPPKTDDRTSGNNQNKSRSTKNRSSHDKTKSQSPPTANGDEAGKELTQAQKSSSNRRSSSRRSRRGPRTNKKVNENGSKNDQSG